MKTTLIFIATMLLFYSCKKITDNQPANSSTAPIVKNYPIYKSGKVTINVRSNYIYPYLAVENGSTTLKRINETPSSYTMPVSYSYSFQANENGTYRIYSLSQEVAKYKSDTLKVWETIQVLYNDTVLMLSTQKQQQTEFYFNIK